MLVRNIYVGSVICEGLVNVLLHGIDIGVSNVVEYVYASLLEEPIHNYDFFRYVYHTFECV